MKCETIFFILFVAFALTGSDFQKRQFPEFLDRTMLQEGNFELLPVSREICKLIPKKRKKDGCAEIVLKLNKMIPVSDDVQWFTIPVFYQWHSGIGANRVAMTLENKDGKRLESISFPRTQESDRAWANMISQTTFCSFPEELLHGLKLKELKFYITKGTDAVFFRKPYLFSGNMFSEKLYATASSAHKMDVWYEYPGKISPLGHSNRAQAFFCSLELSDGFQKEPFYTDSGFFDYCPINGKNDPHKADRGFEIPVLPKGIYLAVLRFHNPQNGTLLFKKEFPYEVLSSSAVKYPAGKKKTSLITFFPDRKDFIYPENRVSGKVCIGELPEKWNPKRENIHLEVTFQESRDYWYPYNTLKPAVYGKVAFVIAPEGLKQHTISFSAPEKLVRQNRAFQVHFELKLKNRTLDSLCSLVGIKGKEKKYSAHQGKLHRWQDSQSKAMFATGLHAGIRLPQADMEGFVRKIKKDGIYDYVKVDAAWSPGTEPLKGFYCFDYIDDWLDLLVKNNLLACLQAGGNMKFPRWAYFELEPDRVHDGRFLKNHYNCYSVYAEAPGKYVREHLLRLAKRYAKSAPIGYYEIWSYMGEGFNFDWWLSWQFGGGVSGYSSSGIRKYHEFIRKKYGTLANLNRAYGTHWNSWDSVPMPQPEKNRKSGMARPPFPHPENLAFRDFEDMKIFCWRDYMEDFLMRKFRQLTPERTLSLFYYGNNNATPGIFRKNPGMLQRNGGGEGIGIPGKENYYFSAAYENTPTMSEDCNVYSDSVKSWQNNIFGNLRIGRLGLHFSNYSIYQTRGNRIELEQNDASISTYFQDFRKNVLPFLKDTETFHPECAVFYDYESRNLNKIYSPAREFSYHFYVPEPLNYMYLERLPRYRLIAMDAGAVAIGKKAADSFVQWVKNGGTLLMTVSTGLRQAETLYQKEPLSYEKVKGKLMPEREKNFLLEKLGIPLPENGRFGNSILGPWYSTNYSRDIFAENGRLNFGREYFNYLFPDDAYPQAETLASFTGMNGFLKGKRAIMKFHIGKGVVFLFSQYPGGLPENFYDTILRQAGVPKYLEIVNPDGSPVLTGSISAYSLKRKNGDRILMVQHANHRDPNYNSSKLKDKEPFRRFIRPNLLSKGRYTVYSLFGGKKKIGTYTESELQQKGFPGFFHFNELQVYLIQKEKKMKQNPKLSRKTEKAWRLFAKRKA